MVTRRRGINLGLRSHLPPRRAAIFTQAALMAAALLVGLASTGTDLLAAADMSDISAAARLYKAGKYAECAELTAPSQATKKQSEYSFLLNMRANMARGQHTQALNTLMQAIEVYPASIRLRWVGCNVLRYNQRAADATKMLDQIGALLQRFRWRYDDAVNYVTLGRFELLLGADPGEVLKKRFNPAKQAAPDYTESYVASGHLALQKHDFEMAAGQFQAAAEIDPTDPDIHFGIARAFEPGDPQRLAQALETALKHNPNHVDSLLLIADQHIDAERYREAAEVLDHVIEVNPSEPRGWAFRAVLAHLANQPDEAHDCHDQALAAWPANPEVDYLIGRELSQKYRFREGASYQEQSLQLDPAYLLAKSQLAQDRLRLGDEQQGWELARQVYDSDAYNIYAHNMVTLKDHLSKFRTLRSQGFILRMDAHEAALFGQRALQLLERAKQTLCRKYEVDLTRPIVVEIFPRQQDFAIRTFGMPGGAGFLGVCFGQVITANSPSSQGASPANWEAVLWHEFCHVVTLSKTNNRMPRWLSEGISVYEELQANPAWGQTMTPAYRQMILAGEATPVSKLSAAFLRPPSPQHLLFAYYQSALVVEYLVQQHGLSKLQDVLVDLGTGAAINEVLEQHIGSLSKIDEGFAEFARQRAEALAPNVDWEPLDLPPSASQASVSDWVQDHPRNYAGLHRLASMLIAAEEWETAKQPLESLLELYPADIGPDNARLMLASVHRELGDTTGEREALASLATMDNDAVDVYLRLATLAAEAGDWADVVGRADQVLAVNPLIKSPYAFLAQAAEHTGDIERAIAASQALLQLQPFDRAAAHYRLATQLQQAKRFAEARRQTLMALELAPRYRLAQQRLVELAGHELVERETAEESPVDSRNTAGSLEEASR